MEKLKFILISALLTSNIALADIVFIVNKKNAINSISKQQLKQIYTLRQKNWESGELIKVYNLKPDSKIRDQVFKKYLNKSSSDLQKHYIRVSLTSMGLPPIEISNEEDLVKVVERNTRAIGYVSKKKVSSKVKEIIITD